MADQGANAESVNPYACRDAPPLGKLTASETTRPCKVLCLPWMDPRSEPVRPPAYFAIGYNHRALPDEPTAGSCLTVPLLGCG